MAQSSLFVPLHVKRIGLGLGQHFRHEDIDSMNELSELLSVLSIISCF